MIENTAHDERLAGLVAFHNPARVVFEVVIKQRRPGTAPKQRIRVPVPRPGANSWAGEDSLKWQAGAALRAARHVERHTPSGSEDLETGRRQRQVRPAIEALTAVTVLASSVDRWQAQLVRHARRRGASWSQIGYALGVSKQAAHERYRNQPRDTVQPG